MKPHERQVRLRTEMEPHPAVLQTKAHARVADHLVGSNTECELPVCDGESLMIAEDDTAACANPSCPNFDRWS